MTNRPLARAPYGASPLQVNPFRSVARDGAHAAGWYRVGPVQALATAPAPAAAGETEQTDTGARSRADVYVFDMLGGWFGVTAEDFVRDVADLDVDELHVHLNSPGGDVAEGVAIANVLRGHRAHVTVWVDGLAASAASVVAMAGDEVVMGVGSQLMLHDAWGIAVGNAAELRQYAAMLDSTSDAIASTYAAKAGGTAAEWRDVLRAEQWYTADEAVAAGLADRVATDDDNGTAGGDPIRPGRSSSGSWWDMWDTLRDPARFDLSPYAFAGRSAAPPPAMPGRQTPAASAAGHTEQEGGGPVVDFTDEQATRMRRELGLADDADPQTIVDAMCEALTERADDDTPDGQPEGQPAGEPALTGAAAAARLPEGLVAVDAGTLEQLQRDAHAGAEARARQQREDRERAVQAAIGDGRIPPARREHWLQALAADSGALATLEALPKGLIPVAPVGHDAPQATKSDDSWFPQYPLPGQMQHAKD